MDTCFSPSLVKIITPERENTKRNDGMGMLGTLCENNPKTLDTDTVIDFLR